MIVRDRDDERQGTGGSADYGLHSERRADVGASAIEYALLLGLIAIVIFAAVALLGVNVADLYSSIATGY